MKDINAQKPWTKSQVSNEKNNVPNSENLLSGYIAGSFNGGHNRTIAYKKVMAGEEHYEYVYQGKFRMLTPKTPAYQNLKLTFRTYFVPNSRIWTDAEAYTAQKGGATEIKIAEIPHIGGKRMPILTKLPTEEGKMPSKIRYSDSILWRDTFISSYYPRLGMLQEVEQSSGTGNLLITMPAASVLPLRGRIAIYNDFERNKEYDEKVEEYKGSTVTDQEWNSYFQGSNGTSKPHLFMRAKRENSYYTDYRTELQGFDSEYPTADTGRQLVDWASWESLIDLARQESLDANLNPWDVIAKIRGSKKLTEGKVQLIGEKTINLNYSAVTQNAYNNNEEIEENFRVLGQQGAYSYTEIKMPIYAGFKANEEGYIHIIATVSADSVFENGWDRNLLNITPLSEYRPELIDQKEDVLYSIEKGTSLISEANYQTWYEHATGFKRKFSELFRLANVVQGDLSSQDYYDVSPSSDRIYENRIITNKTFQFFEIDDVWDNFGNGGLTKNLWQDYTDRLINKNLAIPFTYYPIGDYSNELRGQNQIFHCGYGILRCKLPVDQSIRDNYTTWGEH